MKIVNLTPHEINLFVNGEEVLKIPVSGIVARIEKTLEYKGYFNTDTDYTIPFYECKFNKGNLEFYNLNNEKVEYDIDENKIYIVSGLVSSAGLYNNFYSPETVRDENNRVIGFYGLSK